MSKQLKNFLEAKGYVKVEKFETFPNGHTQEGYQKASIKVVVTETDDTTVQVVLIGKGSLQVQYGENRTMTDSNILGPLLDELEERLLPRLKNAN